MRPEDVNPDVEDQLTPPPEDFDADCERAHWRLHQLLPEYYKHAYDGYSPRLRDDEWKLWAQQTDAVTSAMAETMRSLGLRPEAALRWVHSSVTATPQIIENQGGGQVPAKNLATIAPGTPTPSPEDHTDPRLTSACERLSKLCGENFDRAQRDRKIKLSREDILLWAEQPDALVPQVAELVCRLRWKPKRAIRELSRPLTSRMRIREIIWRVTANGGRFEFTIGTCSITMTRRSSP